MNKDLILCISPEWTSGGCGVLRVQHNVNYINQNWQRFGVKIIMTPEPIFDGNILQCCRCVFVQRPFNPMPWLKNYKELQPKFGYSIVAECDDLFTEYRGQFLPEYHPNYRPMDFKQLDNMIAMNLSFIDRFIVSTDYLAKVLHEKFNYWNTVTIPNVATKSIWQSNRKDFFRKKPLVLSASALQHYKTPVNISPQCPTGVIGMRGDYTGEWVEFIKKNIDFMDLHYFADVPYFFDSIREKITLHPWKSTDLYAAEYNNLKPDIVFAPLKNNIFNRCKSKLKFTEACAAGAILIGTVFEDSPYNCIHPLCKVPDNPTADQLSTIFNNAITHWKEILDYQYNFINSNGEFLESYDHVAKWLYACGEPNMPMV